MAFIVDKVQTGGGSTGTFWAHKKWGLDNPPDIVTFTNKLQTGGYYTKLEFRPKEGYRIFNTWMGDPSKIIQLQAHLDAMENERLLENTIITGRYLLNGLNELQSQGFRTFFQEPEELGPFAQLIYLLHRVEMNWLDCFVKVEWNVQVVVM